MDEKRLYGRLQLKAKLQKLLTGITNMNGVF